jgi:hypothetical protein
MTTREQAIDTQFKLLTNPEVFKTMSWKDQQRNLKLRYIVVKRIDKKGVMDMVKRTPLASKGFIKVKPVLPIQNNA